MSGSERGSGASARERERAVSGGERREVVPGLVTPALLETVTTQLLLHGNAFVQLICGGDGLPGNCSRCGRSG